MTDLAVADLVVEYARGDYTVRALDGLSFEAGSGELVLLLGPSGCGKTTLLSCLSGILTPTSGSIRAGDVEVTGLRGPDLDAYRRRTVGMVFQSFNLIPSLTATENVEAPLRLGGVARSVARRRAAELLDLVGLTDRAGHRPGSLSGGQQQRVAIARGLAHDPPLILADEPTAHLDYIQVEGILQLIRGLAQPGRTVVVSTHDERIVPLADRVVELAPRFAGHITRAPEVVAFTAGRTIFEQGSRGELIYFVEQGVVDIVRVHAGGAEEVVAQVREGKYFGELGPLLGFPRTATARAQTDVVLTGYGVGAFRQMAAEDPTVSSILGAAARAVEDRPRRPRTRGGGRKTPARRSHAP